MDDLMKREHRLVELEDEVRRLRQALAAACAPLPSTAGMGPPDRAQRLHAEFERRVVNMRRALDAGTIR